MVIICTSVDRKMAYCNEKSPKGPSKGGMLVELPADPGEAGKIAGPINEQSGQIGRPVAEQSRVGERGWSVGSIHR